METSRSYHRIGANLKPNCRKCMVIIEQGQKLCSKCGETVTYDIEVTDTFGGEANYSWVRRYSVTFNSKLSKLARMRLFKQKIGWNGSRCKVSDYGDSLRIDLVGACQVAFVSYSYN